ncbi:MAG: nicotinate-nucleotide diphosphorylase (carboxylating) [Gammaproteobacteria bacterium]|nr:nicotinate-nucleotide diphosphorylase (carboxylating) [Gammaproteobacteria bacterium]|tara:strand:- start:994 stop:1815 length:822 start_codon:yes stop_codon:yes gene_type:complete
MNNKLKQIHLHIINSLNEDSYKNDITAKLIPINKKAEAQIKSKESFYVYGMKWMKKVFKIVDPNLTVQALVKDGEYIKKNQLIAKIKGNNRNIIIAERTALNYLQSMSGVYDNCMKYQKKISKTKIKILHTRKTLPLTRLPYGEACLEAGCPAHRKSLSDTILFKENHLRFIHNFQNTINAAKKTGKKVVVEVQTLKFAKYVNRFKVDRILLDNFKPQKIKEVIKCVRKCEIEISGSINLKNINKFAIKGVDFISIGDLTKNIFSKDISLLIV